ncbi:MAG: C69 family dipeptidase [Paludibacteraceae bacterium]|nr:C69 family dipeptidase [Paludibacteraceae bacterium]
MKKSFLLLLAASLYVSSWACTNFLVGKDASADGSTIISYAADSYSLYGFLHHRPAADHAPGSVHEVRDWDTGRPLGSIPEVAHTYSVIGNMNEHQLTIGETTWGGREELWDTVGIDYGSLIYIALERCKTAREAIRCITDLVAEYGYASEGESFSIGDPEEVWILDLIGKGQYGKGAVWVATRVPDDCISAHANQCRTTLLDLSQQKIRREDKRTQLWSKDVIRFARERGYFNGKDAEFNYQEAYCPYDFSGLYVCEARVWSFFRHFADMDRYFDYATGKTFVETGGRECGERMPLFIKPDRKVSVQDIKECMRDEYQGTPLALEDKTAAGPWQSKLRHGGLAFTLDSVKYWYERPTATQQTGWSFVAQMRGYADPKAGGIFWFGVDDAACSMYVPMYCRILHVPECFAEGNGDLYTYSPTSAWWTFNIVANWAYNKYNLMKPEIARLQAAWDDKFNSQVPGVDAQAAALDDREAREFLTNYSCSQAENVVVDWQNLGTYLMVKYIDGQVRKEEDGRFKRNAWGEPVGPNRPPFPESFLRTIAPETAHE